MDSRVWRTTIANQFCASREVDCAEFTGRKNAYELLHLDRIRFLDRLISRLQGIPDEKA